MSTIRELHEAQDRAWKGWRSRFNDYEMGRAAAKAFREAGEALRDRLPFRTSIAYAYSPRENVGSNGGDHIICGEDLSRGRLHRKAGDALCKPRSKFWGLEQLDDRGPSCLRCLEIAERLANETTQEYGAGAEPAACVGAAA